MASQRSLSGDLHDLRHRLKAKISSATAAIKARIKTFCGRLARKIVWTIYEPIKWPLYVNRRLYRTIVKQPIAIMRRRARALYHYVRPPPDPIEVIQRTRHEATLARDYINKIYAEPDLAPEPHLNTLRLAFRHVERARRLYPEVTIQDKLVEEIDATIDRGLDSLTRDALMLEGITYGRYKHWGAKRKAIAPLKRALELALTDVGRAHAHHHIGRVSLELNRRLRALYHLKKALALDPSHFETQKLIDQIDADPKLGKPRYGGFIVFLLWIGSTSYVIYAFWILYSVSNKLEGAAHLFFAFILAWFVSKLMDMRFAEAEREAARYEEEK